MRALAEITNESHGDENYIDLTNVEYTDSDFESASYDLAEQWIDQFVDLANTRFAIGSEPWKEEAASLFLGFQSKVKELAQEMAEDRAMEGL